MPRIARTFLICHSCRRLRNRCCQPLPIDFDSTRCYNKSMSKSTHMTERTFKTAWFSRAARKAHIKDDELCQAVQEIMKGQADNLGGGVFKKRLGKNRHRSIVIAKGGKYWVYAYLFAKKDRANIEDDELAAFRDLADLYAKKTDEETQRELESKELLEICHEDKVKV